MERIETRSTGWDPLSYTGRSVLWLEMYSWGLEKCLHGLEAFSDEDLVFYPFNHPLIQDLKIRFRILGRGRLPL